MFKQILLASTVASVFSVNVFAEDQKLFDKVAEFDDSLLRIDAAHKVTDESGLTHFLIRFKSTQTVTGVPAGELVMTRKDNRIALMSRKIDKPEPLTEEVMAWASDNERWADNDSLASIDYLKDVYNINAKIVSSIIDKVVSAYLTDNQACMLLKDDLIDMVVPNTRLTESSWSDTVPPSGQVTSWGITATNSATMANSSSGYVYMVDSVLPPVAVVTLSDHSNIQRLNNFPYMGGQHAVYTSAILGAKNNNIGARGIFFGNIVHAAYDEPNADGIMRGLDVVFADAENKNIFTSVNISLNPNEEELKVHNNLLHQSFAVASNRLLISQSAGNALDNACNWSYVPQVGYGGQGSAANPVDGIMVVGGYDNAGQMAKIWPDRYNPAGSNFGACVDVWGPARHIFASTYPNNGVWQNWEEGIIDNEVFYAANTVGSRGYIKTGGGTSYAAPFVTGIAAAYSANNAIRPPQLESMIRVTMRGTGYNDQGGYPIKSVYYSASAASQGIKYVKPVFGFIPSHSAESLTDGKTNGFAWNGGSNSPSLQFTVNGGVKVVRFTPRGPSEDGQLNYTLEVFNDTNDTYMPIVSGTTYTHDRVPVVFAVPAHFSTGGYRLKFHKPNGGWVALAELETYQ